MGLRQVWRYLFSEPAEHNFSANYQPVNALVQGLYPGFERNIDRQAALAVPAFKRGRDLIAAIGSLPLETVREDNTVVVNPFLRQIDPNIANVVTMTQTVEDLLCSGVAWWRITQRQFSGYPMYAYRVDPLKVSITAPNGFAPSLLPSGLSILGVVWINGQPVPKTDVIRFDSPNEPVLGPAGRRVLARAIALEDAAETYASSPRPMDYFTPVDGADPVDDGDVAVLLDDWGKARRQRATAYVPAALAYNEVQQPTPADLQLVQLQERVSLDIANLMGIEAEDVGVSTTSRTYKNAVDRRKDRVNDTLSSYMRAVTDRLSMGDVTVAGQTVRFNLGDYLKADPKTRAEVQQIYAAIGVTDAEEIREQEGLPPRVITPPAPAPIPATVGAPVQPKQIQAAARPLTFARQSLTFEGDALAATFAVDTETRTITGLAVPFGQSAKSGGKSWRFAPGSVKWASVNRVKLLRDHNNSLAMGKAISLTETPAGLVATFKVSAGPLGDEALALAFDGVLDGLSIGVEFRDEDTEPDPTNPGGFLVKSAALREISLTAVPAFDDSRLTSVRASDDERTGMPDEKSTTPVVEPDTTVIEKTTETKEFAAALTMVDPAAHAVPTAVVSEALPYNFDRGGNFAADRYDFSTDLREMAHLNDPFGRSEAGKRVMGLIQARFVNTNVAGVGSLNPTILRNDLYVDQHDYRYPLFAALDKGAPPNGVTPFVFPKFNSNGTLVQPHVEGTEPAAGNFTTTNQTVTPTALSGKASLTREVWDQGGNPAVSSLIWRQMQRAWFEGLETSCGAFLNSAATTGAVVINLNTGAGAGVAPTSLQLENNWESGLAALQYVRQYDWSYLALEQYAYQAFVLATDTAGRRIYPIIAPANANGTAESRFRSLNLAGVTGIPAWGLGAGTAGAVNNSWLFDPAYVNCWSTAPMRLEFPGTNAAGGYAPIAMVDIGIWGYQAFALTDLAAVRKVTYDTTT